MRGKHSYPSAAEMFLHSVFDGRFATGGKRSLAQLAIYVGLAVRLGLKLLTKHPKVGIDGSLRLRVMPIFSLFRCHECADGGKQRLLQEPLPISPSCHLDIKAR